MALTATIEVNPSTVLINQQASATLTVSNSGGGAIDLLSVTPTAVFTGTAVPAQASVGLGSVPLSSGFVTSVPAGGDLVLSFSCVFFSPSTGIDGTGSGTYDIGAVILAADGSIFSPSADTVTVDPLPLPSSEL